MGAFGIEHSTVGALWVEALGFPQPVADPIRRATNPPSDADSPLDLALLSACSMAVSVARNDSAEAAWPALQAEVRSRFADAGGQPDAAFSKLHEGLQETKPAI